MPVTPVRAAGWRYTNALYNTQKAGRLLVAVAGNVANAAARHATHKRRRPHVAMSVAALLLQTLRQARGALRARHTPANGVVHASHARCAAGAYTPLCHATRQWRGFMYVSGCHAAQYNAAQRLSHDTNTNL